MMMMSKKMCVLHKVAMGLLIVGGLNWLLVGALKMNLVTSLFGTMPTIERLIYILVGLSALAMLGVSKCCMKGGMCGCSDDKCGHCAPEEKKDAPAASGSPKM
jgi:uncharacterized membrane protein YuzA (DUF378 family)